MIDSTAVDSRIPPGEILPRNSISAVKLILTSDGLHFENAFKKKVMLHLVGLYAHVGLGRGRRWLPSTSGHIADLQSWKGPEIASPKPNHKLGKLSSEKRIDFFTVTHQSQDQGFLALNPS